MSKSDEENKSDDSLKKSVGDLILSINNKGNIKKFNSECEKVTGYNKNEIVNTRFVDFLIPENYHDHWDKIFDSIKKNKILNDFELPFLTSHGHEIMIYWSSFPVKNSDGNVTDISFVGKLIDNWDDSKSPVISRFRDVDNFSEDYFDDFDRVINELQNKNRQLEEKLEDFESKKSGYSSNDLLAKSLYRFSFLIGGKKKREEFDAVMKELDEREKYLKQLEVDLQNDKKKINQQMNDFIKWREELETVESEIESRHKWVVNKEKSLEKYSKEQLDSKVSHVDQTRKDISSFEEIFKISDCAAVLQRGIFKQVNGSLANLLGYSVDELSEKSLFDFIVPESLSGLEEYYLHRLRGDDISFFQTVFLTKNNDKVAVEVNTKPTFIDNEKAEIAIFKKLESKNE